VTISFVAQGTGSNSTTTVAPLIPAGLTNAVDIMLLLLEWRSTASAPAAPTGWSTVATVQVTHGAEAADTGTAAVCVYQRVFATGDSGPSIDVTGRNGGRGVILGWTRSAGSGWDVASATGTDATIDTSHSAAATADPGGAAGDLLVALVGVNGDNIGTANSALAATWTGCTLGTVTERQSGSTTSGNDLLTKIEDVPVSSGTSSGNPSVTWTWTGTATADNPAAAAVYVRLREQVSAADIPWRPWPPMAVAVPSQAPWSQRDRRDANTVAVAADPLPAPLDSAWQAGGRYWHLSGDAGDTAPRTWQSLQRSYISDPSLLAAASADPLSLPDARQRQAAVADLTDRREVPAQRAYVSAPGMLSTALLENELLGAADMGRRAAVPATHAVAPRWWPPQQPRRAGWSPGLLDGALLEDVLLGSADDLARHRAWYADRRLVPQQRLYGVDPALLASALLENELLGSSDDLARHRAWFTDRRETPQQRAYVSDPSLLAPLVPADPLAAAWLATWLAYNRAATHADRRVVPQQRPYLSDPSFYPTVAPTDPLTLAWGSGGTYWLAYNTAALQVDRRLAPQQRPYRSDPALLGTALLENELLGSADDLARHRAWYADRRLVPQQPRRSGWSPGLLDQALLEDVLLGSADDLARHRAWYADRRETVAALRPVDPALLAPAGVDPLTVAAGTGGDLWRRAATPATNADRREVPQQPPRWTVFFDAGPDSPPLTLAWGAGGPYWHRYNQSAGLHAAGRIWWPPPPARRLPLELLAAILGLRLEAAAVQVVGAAASGLQPIASPGAQASRADAAAAQAKQRATPDATQTGTGLIEKATPQT